jgi:urea carboxylase
MALYNVESPGGYQLTGLTIPGCDILGSKNHYSLERPWLFEDFDQLRFYQVSEVEYERQLALFHSGRYEYEIEDTVFDMAEHNRLLEETREEVKGIRGRQKLAQDEMQKVEDELMEKWTKEKAEGKIPMDKVEALLNDPAIQKISSPLNANVWKVTAEEGDEVSAGDVVAILEAMKLEISLRAEDGMKGKVEKLLVRPGDVVNAGDPLVLVREG